MDKIKVVLIALVMAMFIGCGSSDNSDSTETVVDLRDELKGDTFYIVKNDVLSRNLFKVTFDENLTTWNIDVYDNNLSSESIDTAVGDIVVTNTTLTDNSGSLKLVSKEDSYIDLVSTVNPLVTLKLFSDSDLAQAYYDVSLEDEVKGKEFFVVQNTITERTLLKLKFDNVLESWDMTVYDKTFSDDNATGTDLGVLIDVTDENITIEKTGAIFRLNSKEVDYLNLVSTIDTSVTLKLYESEQKALEYFNSFDLRDELKNNTFYTVRDNGTNKSLFKFVFTDDVTKWDFNVYDNNYTEEATTTGSSTILISEDRLTEDGGDILVFDSKEEDYLNLISLSNSSITYRLYSSPSLAETYFNIAED